MDSAYDSYDYAEQGLPPEQIGGGNGATPYRLSRILVPTYKASPSSHAAAKIRRENAQKMEDEEPISIDTEGPIEQPCFGDDDKENKNTNMDGGDVFGGPPEPSLDVSTTATPFISPPVRENVLHSPPTLSEFSSSLDAPSSPALSRASASLSGTDSAHPVECPDLDKSRDENDDDDYSSDDSSGDTQPRTPRGKPGRPSRDIQRQIEELFEKTTALFEETSSETGRSVESLIQDWGRSVGSPIRKASNNRWNLYEQYFSDPKNCIKERRRVGRANADSKFSAFIHSASCLTLITGNYCWVTFKSAYPDDWEKMLLNHKAQQVTPSTLQQRNRRFHATFSSLMKLVSLFLHLLCLLLISTKLQGTDADLEDMQLCFVLVGGCVNEDAHLGGTWMSPGLDGVSSILK